MNSTENHPFELLFLGTGTSTGVPIIGCECPVCLSKDPRNNRLRASVILEYRGFHLLIDTGPDFRQQALRYEIPRVDAILITHAHTDHIFGMDDIRRFNTIQQSSIPVYATPFAISALRRIYHYFTSAPVSGAYLPRVDFCEINDESMELGPFVARPFPVEHGRDPTLGFRIDAAGAGVAYVPDCARFTPRGYEVVRGVDVMILDGLRHRPHGSHMTVEQSLETLRRIGAPRSYLTHIAHDIDHPALLEQLPKGIEPAYDGLRLRLG